MAQLCVTIGAPTLAALRERRDAATRYGDLVELRLDTLADPDPAGALQGRTGPVIVTCRPTWEGGHFAGSEEARLRLLKQAWDLGAEFVDVEWASLGDAPWAHGERLVLSSHDFQGVPFDMAARYAAMHAAEPGVVKLAVTAARLTDTLALPGPKPPSNRRQGAPRDRRARSGHAAGARSLRVRLDVCRGWVGARTDSGRSSPPRISVRQHLAARRSLRRRPRPPGTRCRRPCGNHAFAAAGLTRYACRSKRRPPTTSSRSPARWACAAPA